MRGRLIAVLALAVIAAILALIYARPSTLNMGGEPRTYNLGEFGIALTVPPDLADLSHEAVGREEIETALVMRNDEECVLGALYMLQKADVADTETGWTQELIDTFSVPTNDRPAQVKEFTNFYLIYEPGEDPCTEEADGTTQKMALWNALSTARFMQ